MKEESWIDFAWWYLLPFGIGTVLMAAINKTVLVFGFHQLSPPDTWTYIRLCIHPIFAAVQEPLTSKFLPAVAVIYLARRRNTAASIPGNALRLGVLGGLTVGVVEALSKMVVPLSVELNAIPPVFMHLVTGAIVSTAVFQYADKDQNLRGVLVLIAAYVLGVAVHLFWNTRVAFWLGGVNPC